MINSLLYENGDIVNIFSTIDFISVKNYNIYDNI